MTQQRKQIKWPEKRKARTIHTTLMILPDWTGLFVLRSIKNTVWSLKKSLALYHCHFIRNQRELDVVTGGRAHLSNTYNDHSRAIQAGRGGRQSFRQKTYGSVGCPREEMERTCLQAHVKKVFKHGLLYLRPCTSFPILCWISLYPLWACKRGWNQRQNR